MSLFHKLRLLMKPLRSYTKPHSLRLSSNVLLRSGNGETKESLIVKKFTELNEAYVRLIGLDEVKRFQDRVIVIQERLERTQDHRRDIGKQLNDVRKHLNRLQEQLHKVNRYEERERFIELTAEETEVIKRERDLSMRFDELDKTEREIFTALCNSVRDSHEKERAQSEYTKYFSIILSIVGTFIGAVLSMLINTVRTKELVVGIERSVDEKMTRTNSELGSIDVKVGELDAKLLEILQTIRRPSALSDTVEPNEASQEVAESETVLEVVPEIVPEIVPVPEPPVADPIPAEGSKEENADKHLTAAAFTLLGVIFVLRVVFGY